MSKKLKITIEWDGKLYAKEDVVESVESTVNPGNKELPLMGETLERLMVEILHEMVKQQ